MVKQEKGTFWAWMARGKGSPGSGMEQAWAQGRGCALALGGEVSAEELTNHLSCLKDKPRGGIIRKSEHKNRG